jgi:hypothetical protein
MKKASGFVEVLNLNHFMSSSFYCGYKVVSERGDLVVALDQQMRLLNQWSLLGP